MLLSGLLSLTGGVLFFLSFPPASFGFLIWIFLVPIFFASGKLSPKGKYFVGFIAFFAGHFLNLYWIFYTVKSAGVTSLISFLALFLLSSILAFLDGFLIIFSKKNSVFVASLAAVIGFLKTKFLSGFPWCALYVALAKTPALLQSSKILGPFFLTFVIVFFNHSLYRGIKERKARYFLAALVLFASNFSFSLLPKVRGKKEKITVCQLNVSQQDKWSAEKASLILSRINLFAEIADKKSDLVVFPESCLPGIVGYDRYIDGFVDGLEREKLPPVLIGAATFRNNKLYNAAILINRGRRQFYFKRKLVPFGEFVPMREIFGRFAGVLNNLGDFDRGLSAKTLVADNLRIFPLICSEVIYPSLWHADANIIVNITNDAWFGRTAAAFQHLAHAIVCAASTGLPVVFADNRGPSAIIDGDGEIVKKSRFYSMSLLSAEVEVPKRGSFYHRHFDLTLPAVFLIIVLFAGRKIWIEKFRKNLRK